MNRLRRHLLLGVVLIAATLITAIATSQRVVAQGPPTANVIVANTAANPVPVHDKVVPFHAAGIVLFTPGSLNANNIPSDITVPVGKRLVIDHVSAEGTVPPGQKITAHIVTSVGGTNAFHELVMTFQGAFPFTDQIGNPITRDIFSLSQPIRMYGESGTTITFEARRNSDLLNASVVFRISGHLVTID